LMDFLLGKGKCASGRAREGDECPPAGLGRGWLVRLG
jgi:hypothetical protein